MIVWQRNLAVSRKGLSYLSQYGAARRRVAVGGGAFPRDSCSRLLWTTTQQHHLHHHHHRISLAVPFLRNDPCSSFLSTKILNEDHDENDFVKSCLSHQERLVGMKLGSLESEHWVQAKDLLWNLRKHPDLSNIPNRVELTFSILDRLCDEAEISKKQKEGVKSSLPLRGFLLGNALLEWRDHVLSSVAAASQQTKKFASKKRNNEKDSIALGGGLRTEAIVRRVERYTETGLFDPQPAGINIILRVIRSVDDPQKSTHLVGAILDRMLEKANHDPFDKQYHPDNVTMTEMLRIWAQSGLPESPQMIDQCLKMLQNWYQQTKREDMKPNAYIFFPAMEAHARHSEARAAFTRIQELFSEMKAYCCSTNEWGTQSYNRVCHALTLCQHPDAVDAARRILDEMCQYFENGNEAFKPNRDSFSIMLKAYEYAGRTKDATALSEYMQQLARKMGDHSFSHDDGYAYNSLIRSHARAGDTNSSESVLFDCMKRGIHVNKESIDEVLLSFAQSRDPKAAVSCARFIKRWQRMCQHKRLPDHISLQSYNKLLACYSNSKAGKEGAELAEELFSWMENHEDDSMKPNGESWLNLIFAWCNAGEPEEAEKWLHKLRELYHQRSESNNKIEIDSRMFGALIEAWGKSKHPHRAHRATAVLDLMKAFGTQPDVTQYTSLMFVWIGIKSGDPVEHVENIFKQMVKLLESGVSSAKPDSMAFNALLTALASSSDPIALERAEEYVKEMTRFGVSVNVYHYNTLMAGWAKCGRADRVEQLFHKHRGLHGELGEASLKPNSFSHTTRVQAWSKAGDPEKTSVALNDWISDCESGFIDRKPATKEFTAILQAWSRSKHPDAGERAEFCLQQMAEFATAQHFDCHPNVFSFTAVISAYANSRSPQAGAKAIHLLNQLKHLAESKTGSSDLQPSIVTYAETIQAVVNSKHHVNSPASVLGLLQELQSKPSHFWQLDPRSCLTKINRALSSPSFQTNNDILDAFKQLKVIVKEARINQVR